jgi:hypothetical protein
MIKFFKAILEMVNSFFVPREMATVVFRYHAQHGRKNPIIKQHAVIARVRRTATPNEVKGLFDLKAPANTTYKVVDVKIYPLITIPKV